MTFVGITFSNQKVPPSADGLLRQTILSDGILYGCGLDFAGFTLTVAAGHLLLGGREIQHPSSESLAIVGASSGYARVVISIDLSKTATVGAFEQIDVSVDYASTADGFPVLEQSEINVSGTKYEAELCVVSLSSGGITGIVRQLPAASLRASSELLTNLLAAGYLVLSSNQLLASVDDIPGDAPANAVFLAPMEG